MAKGLSFAELSALYLAQKSCPPPLFENDTALPGRTVADQLDNLFFRRQNGPVPHDAAVHSDDGGIAVCIVIVDELFHEDVWRRWCAEEEVPEAKGPEAPGKKRRRARVFIHAKHPEKVVSAWVRQRLVATPFQPEWNSLEVVQALLSLLEAALVLEDGDRCSDRFLLATETCLPLYDLQTTGDLLFSADEKKSWMPARHTPHSKWEAAACFRAVDAAVVPPAAVCKSAPGWIVLARLHAQEIVHLAKMLGGWGSGGGDDEAPGPLVAAWRGVFAPEEMFFPTVLCILGYLRQDERDSVRRCAPTFAEWAKRGDAHPVVHDRFGTDIVARMRRAGALFGRKFAKNSVDAATWGQIVAAAAAVVPRNASHSSNQSCC